MRLPSRWLSGAVSKMDKPANLKSRSEASEHSSWCPRAAASIGGSCSFVSGCRSFMASRTDRQLEGRSLFFSTLVRKAVSLLA